MDSLAQGLLEASKKHLAKASEQVFDRYSEAPKRVDTGVAERFLRTVNLAAITLQRDPLSLVKVVSGQPRIDSTHKALASIRYYIDLSGAVEGKRLTERFSGAPFGWSPDTLRYLVAALLVAGEIKLKVSGKEVTANGQQAIDALKTNNAFKRIGVALRQDTLAKEVLAKAATRLAELIGDMVVPLEPDICKAASKHLPQFQTPVRTARRKTRNTRTARSGTGTRNQPTNCEPALYGRFRCPPTTRGPRSPYSTTD